MKPKIEQLSKIRISATTLGDLLLKAWDICPEKDALIFPEERKDYEALVSGAMTRAQGLMGLGIRPGDHVGILLPSGIAFVETLFAVALCGAVSVLLNSRYRPSELAYITENADLTAIVSTGETSAFVDFPQQLTAAFPALPFAREVNALTLEQAPRLRSILLLDSHAIPGFVDQRMFDEAAAAIDVEQVHQARLGVRIRDTAMILYTSGTSSKPKGCLLSHEAIVREACNLSRNRWQFTADERVWSPMPLFHVAAISAMLAAIDVGGTFIGQPHFDAGTSLAQIRDERPTMMFLPFVTFHLAMIDHPDWDRTSLDSIRLGNSCFAFMPEAVGAAYRAKAPHILQCGTFGMTETSGVVATGGYDMDPEMGFSKLGYPLVGLSVRIVDMESGIALPANQRGEVLVKGYSLFDGYYRDETKTRETIDEQGWYHSGDIGSIDDHGHLMFHGRFKDMLKVGGENVAAAEVEAVLALHPSVKLAQVVGIPDDRLAEIPVAFIETHAGNSVAPEDLVAFVRQRLASFKAPRHIRFVQEWPMSASKIQKFKLREELMAELGLIDA